MEQKPDMIVAVDFGMTCTGVAYAALSRSQNVRYIQQWPGRANAAENKVPTVVSYSSRSGALSSWGFYSETQHEREGPDRDYCQWFKTYLDADVLRSHQIQNPHAAPRNAQLVEKWAEDYLRSLYVSVRTKLLHEIPQGKSWETARIVFVFSVPTTWAPQPTVARFKAVAARAGWGSGAAHELKIGLTEAEAAAVHVACNDGEVFRDGDVLMVADCGGGTTDLNVLRVTGTHLGVPSLQQLSIVDGQTIGSAQIDMEFEMLAEKRLRAANASRPMHMTKDLRSIAWSMMKSNQYQDAKCTFGSPDDVDFRVDIPGLPYNYSNPQHHIYGGAMQFTLHDLQMLFATQLARLFTLIDGHFRKFAESHPGTQVSHLVLSGGLGNSPHVQKQLRLRYAMNANTFPNAVELSVTVSQEPQLAVCKGVCLDEVKKLQRGSAVLSVRCCRASYGTDCKILYDPRNPEHTMKRTKRDELDGLDYIMNGVAWFIKKGEPIDVSKPVVQHFTRKIKPGDPRRAFSDKVIISQHERNFLPLQYGEGAGAEVLCHITSDLSNADEQKFKLKNRHWWQSSKDRYMRIKYEVRVLIGPADITFELWFEGQRMSHAGSIPVQFADVGSSGGAGSPVQPQAQYSPPPDRKPLRASNGYNEYNVANANGGYYA